MLVPCITGPWPVRLEALVGLTHGGLTSQHEVRRHRPLWGCGLPLGQRRFELVLRLRDGLWSYLFLEVFRQSETESHLHLLSSLVAALSLLNWRLLSEWVVVLEGLGVILVLELGHHVLLGWLLLEEIVVHI